jgi:2'-5' RNA ligase
MSDDDAPLPRFEPPPGPESEDDDAPLAERPEAIYVEHVRAFIAVDVPIAVARELGRAQAELRSAWEAAGLPRVAWVPPENIHLTLKFLGSIPAPAAEAILGALADVAAGARRLPRGRVRGLGAFPNPSRPTTLWAGVDDQGGGGGGGGGSLAALAAAVEARCEELGFPREARAWTPHITLGRVKDKAEAGGHPEVVISPFSTREFGELTARELVLYRSVTSPKGAQYTPLGRVALPDRPDRRDR